MPLVNVILNGRAYTVSCDEGEQDHVRDLGQFLDKRVRELTASVGQVGDARLLLMAALTIADELSESLAKISERDKEIAALSADTSPSDGLTESLDNAAARIEALAATVARA